jgi:cytochrome bd ubiquinol oxidase subunit II
MTAVARGHFVLASERGAVIRALAVMEWPSGRGGAPRPAQTGAFQVEASRYTAAFAVAAIIAGWALAQSPVFLEGLTVREAAAGRDTLVAVTVAVLAGAAILFPSLALLFRLVLGGDLGRCERAVGQPPQARSLLAALAPGLLPRLAIALPGRRDRLHHDR